MVILSSGLNDENCGFSGNDEPVLIEVSPGSAVNERTLSDRLYSSVDNVKPIVETSAILSVDVDSAAVIDNGTSR